MTYSNSVIGQHLESTLEPYLELRSVIFDQNLVQQVKNDHVAFEVELVTSHIPVNSSEFSFEVAWLGFHIVMKMSSCDLIFLETKIMRRSSFSEKLFLTRPKNILDHVQRYFSWKWTVEYC